MFGRGFRKFWRAGFGCGRQAPPPGYGRADWRSGAALQGWEAEGWGGPPPWARRWGVNASPAERKAWLEEAKSHLQARLEEIEQELESLNSPPSE